MEVEDLAVDSPKLSLLLESLHAPGHTYLYPCLKTSELVHLHHILLQSAPVHLDVWWWRPEQCTGPELLPLTLSSSAPERPLAIWVKVGGLSTAIPRN